MVGRKKRSTSTRHHFGEMNAVQHQQQQQQQQQHHQQYNSSTIGGGGGGDFGHNNYRSQFSNANGTCRNGSLADSEYPIVTTTTFRRRPKHYNNNHYNHRNQQNAVNNNTASNLNGTCITRSASREAGSASAGSVISGDPDEDGFLSGSGQEIDPDDLLLSVERRSVALMTEKGTSCSVSTQTNDCMNSDLLLAVCKMKRWQRVEAIAEVVQCLNAHEQRYIGSCVEAAVRSNSSYLRQHEIRYNDAHFIQNFIQTASYNRLLELAFPILCLLHSTNRQAAAAYMRLLDRLFSELITASANKTPIEKEEMLDSLRLAVSAALHHAAFSVEHKIRLESLRTYLENLSPQSDVEKQSCEASTSGNDDVPTVISRLDAEAANGDASPNIISITVSERVSSKRGVVISDRLDQFLPSHIEWSDSRTSYMVRTADQIADLHNRLLDSFPSEAGAQTENPRVLPYLNRSQPSSILGYIRALPDLPARVLVCPIVRDFFYPSRLESCSLSTPPQSLSSHSLPSLNDLKNPSATSASDGRSLSATTATTTVITTSTTTTTTTTTTNTPAPLPETPVCHPSVPVAYLPQTTVCSAGMLGCNNASCQSFSLANVPPPRGPLLSLPARQLTLLSAAGATAPAAPAASATGAYPALLSLPQNPNGLSCCNCAGRHPFAYCPQPTMLQVIASGEYRIDYNNITTSTTNSPASAMPSEITGSVASIANSISPSPVNFSTPPPAPNSY